MVVRTKDLLLRYGVSLIVFFFAFLLTRLLWPIIRPSPVPLFFAAIIAAFWGGFGPGLFISVVSALTIDYFFVLPFNHFEWSAPNSVRMGVFIVVSSLISWLNGTRKRLMDERGKLLTQIEGFNEDLRREVASATQELGQANDALLKTQQHLVRSERLAVVGQMAASLAHEVGTPLNAISGHLELLADDHSSDSEARRRIRIIRKQLDFIVGTVKRLLEWTHKRKLALKPVNLDKLIREVLWLVGPTLDEHSITAKLTAKEQLPTIEADRESLQQVFLNLINNSIEAMPVGGRIEITTGVDVPSGKVEIVFRDSGAGIQADAAQHLFEPMWTTKPSGGGFGLAIAREVMNDHGGDIQLVDNQSAGAAFRLTIPIAQSEVRSVHDEEVMSYVA
jgi:signal transduction histidine kinase